jgi:glycosyltransferase involved in cell wall biosynthesis
LWLLLIYERTKSDQRYLQFEIFVRGLAIKEFTQNTVQKNFSDYIFILIPAYNEADNLSVILPRIPNIIREYRVKFLVIDDGSTDDTINVAKQNGALIAAHYTNRGGGAALKTGYDIIKNLKPLIIVTMDADGQHNPEEIHVLVEPILNDNADFVIGSRVLGTCEKYSGLRSAGVHFFSKIINVIMGTKITDCSSGFRAFNKSVLENCFISQEQYHTAELIIEASKRDFRIQERPITISKRLMGKSKKGSNFKYGLFFLRTILKTWWR